VPFTIVGLVNFGLKINLRYKSNNQFNQVAKYFENICIYICTV